MALKVRNIAIFRCYAPFYPRNHCFSTNIIGALHQPKFFTFFHQNPAGNNVILKKFFRKSIVPLRRQN